MEMLASLLDTLSGNPLTNVPLVLAVMAILSLVEAVAPLHARGPWGKAHRVPNLALTFITFATYLVFSLVMVAVLGEERDGSRGGLLGLLGFGTASSAALSVLVLDFSFYVAHRAMHRIPLFWRFHRVHHSDPFVDVTTTVRQHPGESLIRFAFTAAFAIPLGASAGELALYRVLQALSGLLEHANLGMSLAADRVLSLVFSWPHMHKVHHSRDARLTDSNFGNIVSWWDRLFATFTPSRCGVAIAYGLEGFDAPALQTTAGLLRMPWSASTSGATAMSRSHASPAHTAAAAGMAEVVGDANGGEAPYRTCLYGV
jgi:sterol desaturase/sphingolipid hydroxylase (fatty acid hydroxylase superfamily)